LLATLVRRVANKSVTSWQQVFCVVVNGIWETTQHVQTEHFALANLLRTCCGLATGKLRGNWCNGFLPLLFM